VSNRIVQTAAAPAAIGPYSQGIIAGGFLFTAGQIAFDPVTMQLVEGDVVVQTHRVMANLQAVLAAAGADWKNVVKMTVFLTNMADFPRVNDVLAEILGESRPARSTVQVAALPRGVPVEIELVAHLG
jgi:2-iminobutanoate/2-iminopropanoate deaminase